MYKPQLEEFKTLCRQGNVIPVYKEYLADMETPVSVLSRFSNNKNVFLLESVEGGERWGRYSFIGINPYALFKVENGVPLLTINDKTEPLKYSGPPLTALREVFRKNRLVQLPELAHLCAGAVGYICYETVNRFEKLPPPKGKTDEPEAYFMLCDETIIFDNVRHTLKIVVCARTEEYSTPEAAYQAAGEKIINIENIIKSVPPSKTHPGTAGAKYEIKANMTREEYCGMVRKAKQYITDGDIIQTVLSQRFSAALTVEPLQVYRALRLINPSPYTFFIKFGEKVLVGASPEILVRLEGRKAVLRPIAGTRKRGKTEAEDRALADELLADEKEKAEHLMLVDLGRNDLGRVAAPASVQVKDFMTVERYSHVMHLVSNVEAQLAPDYDAFNLLQATFPAGTLSGAPKIRAMEIINELEPDARGPYGGAAGYIGFNGNMDMAITIRTLEINGNIASVQTGAGIVYDSDPEREYEETVQKATAAFKALELAARGLEL